MRQAKIRFGLQEIKIVLGYSNKCKTIKESIRVSNVYSNNATALSLVNSTATFSLREVDKDIPL